MNYQKLDPALTAAIEEAGEGARFSVFLHLLGPLPTESSSVLRNFNIDPAETGVGPIPLDLALSEVAKLSEQPWVGSLRLARVSRPMQQSGSEWNL